MEIIPDLHQLEIPIPDNPLGHLNVYAIRQEDGWTIVDTGIDRDEAYQSLVAQVTEVAGDISNLKRVIITHHHMDHFALARRIREASGAQVLMHEVDVELINAIQTADGASTADSIAWLVANGMPREEAAGMSQLMVMSDPALRQRFVPDVALSGGERLTIGRFTFDVIWTPGHSPGHICLYEPRERFLIAGDHVLPVITPSVGYSRRMGDVNPLDWFLTSLRAVAKLDVSLVLPAHEHAFQDLRGRIDEIILHHDNRCAEILDAVDGSARSAYQICSKITWAEGQMKWPEMPFFHRFMAIQETLAHLRFMDARGSVTALPGSGNEVDLWEKA